MALGFEKMKASTWKGALPFSKYSAKREVCALVELDLKIIPKNSILPLRYESSTLILCKELSSSIFAL